MISQLVHIMMPVTIVLAFLWAPSAEILGHTSRVIYFHVPVAWVSVLSFLVSGILSIIYLKQNGKNSLLEQKAHASALIGVFFTVMTVITGSIWAKISWGTYWNWDPRETSIVILLLIYIAYFSLRAALEGSPGRGRISSSYLIFAMVVMPFFVFVVPRVYHSLHPDTLINTENKLKLDSQMRTVLLCGALSFTLLYMNLYRLASRILTAKKTIEDTWDE